jgi:hypothetical protein
MQDPSSSDWITLLLGNVEGTIVEGTVVESFRADMCSRV